MGLFSFLSPKSVSSSFFCFFLWRNQNGECNKEAFCKKQGGILFLNLNSCAPYCIYVSLYLYLCLSMKSKSFKTRFISLFLMPKYLPFCLFLCFFLHVPHPFSISSPLSFSAVRTYVFHMLGTYVTILCNWLIL